MNIIGYCTTHYNRIRLVLSQQQSNWIYVWSTRLSLASIAVTFILIAIYWQYLPPQIPLWYSRAWGEARLANSYWILLLPGMSCVWLGVNILINIYALPNHRIIGQSLYAATSFVSFFSLITVINIILLML